MIKIFQIGFNRTATQSLRSLFLMSGFRAAHNVAYNHNLRKIMPIAESMEINRSNNNKLLFGIENYNYYGDMETVFLKRKMVLQGYTLFERLDKENENSKFILNIRDVNKWIHSRLSFDKSYFKVYQRYYDLTEEEVIFFWVSHYNNHILNVKKYFQDKPNKLIVFDIDKDKIDKLIDSMSDVPGLEKKFWQKIDRKEETSLPANAKVIARYNGVEDIV